MNYSSITNEMENHEVILLAFAIFKGEHNFEHWINSNKNRRNKMNIVMKSICLNSKSDINDWIIVFVNRRHNQSHKPLQRQFSVSPDIFRDSNPDIWKSNFWKHQQQILLHQIYVRTEDRKKHLLLVCLVKAHYLQRCPIDTLKIQIIINQDEISR